MIIFFTAMSKNARLELLAGEMAAMPEALEAAGLNGGPEAVILARVVPGLTPANWLEVSRSRHLEQWRAFPVPDNCGIEEGPAKAIEITPFREVSGALTHPMFVRLLKRELQRLARNGGCLSLLGIGIAESQRVAAALGETTMATLEGVLGSIILARLEECDSLGVLRRGQYLCCLPGLGQLAARSFAEKAQAAFVEAAKPYFPTGGLSAGKSADSAIGIVNVLQGDHAAAEELIRRVKMSLELALSKERGHIQQETAATPLENTTLVQSSEKRFLFFGGDPT